MKETAWKSEFTTRAHGIEKSRLPKIFEPFYTTRDMGTGLGLAVVSRILEGYQGENRYPKRSREGYDLHNMASLSDFPRGREPDHFIEGVEENDGQDPCGGR